MAISSREAAARVAVPTRRATELESVRDPDPDAEAAGLRDSHVEDDMTDSGRGRAGRSVAQTETEAIRNISDRPTKEKTGDQCANNGAWSDRKDGDRSRIDGRDEQEHSIEKKEKKKTRMGN